MTNFNRLKQLKGMNIKGLTEAARISFSDQFNFKKRNLRDNTEHCQAAVEWLARAQDAATGGGVSSFYNVLTRKWATPYPETTGYIIQTMLEYAEVTGQSEYKQRALRMADWEIAVQMENGAVQSGCFDPKLLREPAVFDTGQVLIGLTRAFKTTSEEKYRNAAERGADWLAEVQDADGAWRVGLSSLTTNPVHTYNTRAAWSLLLVYELTADDIYKQKAIRNIDWALTQQLTNGWFGNSAFNSGEDPLLHTISYVIEGILECGLLLNNKVYINAAKETADALLNLQQPDGSLFGKYNDKWKPSAKWSCLTGDAQVSIIWLKLFEITRDVKYLIAASNMNRYLKMTQDLKSSDPGVRGGDQRVSAIVERVRSVHLSKLGYQIFCGRTDAERTLKFFSLIQQYI